MWLPGLQHRFLAVLARDDRGCGIVCAVKRVAVIGARISGQSAPTATVLHCAGIPSLLTALCIQVLSVHHQAVRFTNLSDSRAGCLDQCPFVNRFGCIPSPTEKA
jgi:hypothetical protein